MKRTVPVLLVFGATFLGGYVVGSGSKKPDMPRTSYGRSDFTGEVIVRTAHGEARRYVPHSVHVDDRPTFVSSGPIRDPVTVVTLDGGRVQIACTETDTTPP